MKTLILTLVIGFGMTLAAYATDATCPKSTTPGQKMKAMPSMNMQCDTATTTNGKTCPVMTPKTSTCPMQHGCNM